MQILERIASGWAPTPRGPRIGVAAALLIRMGIHHLTQCAGHNPDDTGVDIHRLRECGVRFVRYVKGMRHVKRDRLNGGWGG